MRLWTAETDRAATPSGPSHAQPDGPIAAASMMLRPATARDQIAAVAFIAVFIAFTLEASRFGTVQGPVVSAFIPVCATLWGSSALLTAFLLFTQFSVNGVRAFSWIGAAYAYTGLLTIPYVAFFPGVFFNTAITGHGEQLSAWLWLDWHLVFPLILIGYRLYDPDFSRRFLSGARIRAGVRLALACVVVGGLCSVGAVVIDGGFLPHIVASGRFTPIWAHVFAPLVFVLNAAATFMIIGFGRKLSLLQLWLGVALMTAALDGALNAFAGSRYTLSWYLGKLETLTTANVVLLMLLSEVGALYRRLGTMAMVDALTGLRNRRSFDEYVRWTLGRRAKAEVAFLLLDIDYFKQFNDRYGHAAGDVCLHSVADTLQQSLLRSVDMVARYGGEEFAVLLPDTSAAGAREVAERIRLGVEALAIANADSAVSAVVTLSIGVAHAYPADGLEGSRLFAIADGALYEAKKHRNETVVAASIGLGVAAVRPVKVAYPG